MVVPVEFGGARPNRSRDNQAAHFVMDNERRRQLPHPVVIEQNTSSTNTEKAKTNMATGHLVTIDNQPQIDNLINVNLRAMKHKIIYKTLFHLCTGLSKPFQMRRTQFMPK